MSALRRFYCRWPSSTSKRSSFTWGVLFRYSCHRQRLGNWFGLAYSHGSWPTALGVGLSFSSLPSHLCFHGGLVRRVLFDGFAPCLHGVPSRGPRLGLASLGLRLDASRPVAAFLGVHVCLLRCSYSSIFSVPGQLDYEDSRLRTVTSQESSTLSSHQMP